MKRVSSAISVRLDVQLVRQMGLDQREHLLAVVRASSRGALRERVRDPGLSRVHAAATRSGAQRSGHSVLRRLAAGADTGARLSAPASPSARVGLPDDVLARAALGAQDRLREARAA